MDLELKAIRHPLTLHTYTAESPDRIRLESRTGWGVFNANGEWIEGPVRSADPTFCRWVASGVVLKARQESEMHTSSTPPEAH